MNTQRFSAVVLAVLLLSAAPASATVASGVYHSAEDISAGTFSSGNFVFQNNLNVTQNLVVDTNTLYVDSSNNRIGIATTNPLYTLHVNGNQMMEGDNSIYFGAANFFIRRSSGNGLELSATNTYPVLISGTAGLKVGDGPLDLNDNLIKNVKLGTNLNANGYNISGLGTAVFSNGLVINGPIQNSNTSQNNGNVYVADTLVVSGNVGIGTTSPTSPLHILGDFRLEGSGGTANYAQLEQISDTEFKISANRGNITINAADSATSRGNIYFQTQGTTDMVLTSSGRLGIGTISPGRKLEVSGSFKATASTTQFIVDDTGDILIGI